MLSIEQKSFPSLSDNIVIGAFLLENVASVCAYCGCGCRLLFVIEDGRIVKMLPYRTDNPSEGTACIKGLTIHETMGNDEGRILSPLVREHRDDPFSETLIPNSRQLALAF